MDFQRPWQKLLGKVGWLSPNCVKRELPFSPVNFLVPLSELEQGAGGTSLNLKLSWQLNLWSTHSLVINYHLVHISFGTCYPKPSIQDPCQFHRLDLQTEMATAAHSSDRFLPGVEVPSRMEGCLCNSNYPRTNLGWARPPDGNSVLLSDCSENLWRTSLVLD